ncbi:protealysin inhibitor emfourin [Nonomuraea sp. NPDC050451]|uniref:protealysin inhibitor emfourin n=1 Tax=Nonomuraea sp. NPDC050451 TaxID=3364364 RepID=UPI00378FACF3
MRVKIERTGGFAGIKEAVAEYDTDDLPEQEAAKVYEALSAIDAATAEGESGEVGADLMNYRITVGNGAGRVYTVSDDPSSKVADPLAVLLRPSA